MMTRTINLGLIFSAVFMLSGCSMFMAMHGQEDANLSVLTVGQDRGIVVLNLGEPSKTYISDGIRVDVHEVQKGNAPSVGRALGHGALDLLTFGGWELIGTPVEGFQGKTFTISIEYDENDKLVSVNTINGRIKEDRMAKEAAQTEMKKVEAEVAEPKNNFAAAQKDNYSKP